MDEKFKYQKNHQKKKNSELYNLEGCNWQGFHFGCRIFHWDIPTSHLPVSWQGAVN
jgi:hypothetical protein